MKLSDKPKTDVEALINLQDSTKPDVIHLSPEVDDFFKNTDVLSMDITIFRNGGTIDNKKSIPFVRLTPELLTLLQRIYK